MLTRLSHSEVIVFLSKRCAETNGEDRNTRRQTHSGNGASNCFSTNSGQALGPAGKMPVLRSGRGERGASRKDLEPKVVVRMVASHCTLTIPATFRAKTC